METLLAADIGGTKSDLAIYELHKDGVHCRGQKRYVNSSSHGIDEITADFLSEQGVSPLAACFAVAGIVEGRKARLTNLPWQLDCHLLESTFGFTRCHLINDMTAVSSALSVLQPEDLMMIQKGEPSAGSIKAVVAPGTGLGEGYLVECNNHLLPMGCEGGHADFAPLDDEQHLLIKWLGKRKKPVSYEMVIAGPGLMNLYDFYRECYGSPEIDWVKEGMAQVVDRTPIIVKAALDDSPCPLCYRVVELFLSILGGEAGNLALKLFATGGMFLGGGILPRLVEVFNFDGFLANFHNKGQMTSFMEKIPVSLILHPNAALLGAQNYGCRALMDQRSDGR